MLNLYELQVTINPYALQGVILSCFLGMFCHAIYNATADIRGSKVFLYVGLLCYFGAIFYALNIVAVA